MPYHNLLDSSLLQRDLLLPSRVCGDVIAGLIKECDRREDHDILDDALQNHRNNV